jgi:hypothetical protein
MDQEERFALQLQREGFEAGVQLWNGQIGIAVGPKGLHRRRMPPNVAGIFLPLWEINAPENRALIAGRKFQEIFESRPPDWKPYRSPLA